MRLDNADPIRALLVFCGSILGVLSVVSLLVLCGAAVEAAWRRIVTKFKRKT